MTTGLVVFIVVSTMLNLGIGYALAVYQGHGPPLELWELLPTRLWPGRMPIAQPLPGGAIADLGLVGPAPEIQVARPPVVPEPIPTQAPVQPEIADTADSTKPSEDASPFKESVAKSRDDVQSHCQQLQQLNEQVREVQAAPTRVDLDRCVSELANTNQSYLEQHDKHRQAVAENVPEAEAHQEIDGQVRQAADSHSEQMRESMNTLNGLEVDDNNLNDYCRQLLAETDHQMESANDFRDALDTAIVGIIDADHDLAESRHESSERDEAVTTVEAAIAEILDGWREDPAGSQQPLAAALIDMDEFSKINEQHGPLAADGVVDALQNVVATVTQEGGQLVHTAGHLFLISFPGISTREVSVSLERIRQTVEKTEFQRDGTTIAVTISSAAVDTAVDDTAQSLCGRLVSCIREVERYGRNRTYVHDGNYPTPVSPPKLNLPNTVVKL